MDARDFNLAKLAVGGLLICTAALAIAGVLSLFAAEFHASAIFLKGVCIVAFAGMAGFSLAVCQAAASCGQLLDGKDNDRIRAIAYACAVVTGLVSVAGVYLGDGILRGHTVQLPPVEAMLAGGFALAFIKPAMTAVITACETKERHRVDGVDALLKVKDDRIAALERELRSRPAPASQPEVVTHLDDHRPRRRRVAQTAAGALLAASTPLVANAGEVSQGVSPPAYVQSEQRPPEARVPSMEEVEDARYQLNLRGVRPSFRTVAAHIGVRKCDIEAVWPKGVPLAFQDAA